MHRVPPDNGYCIERRIDTVCNSCYLLFAWHKLNSFCRETIGACNGSLDFRFASEIAIMLHVPLEPHLGVLGKVEDAALARKDSTDPSEEGLALAVAVGQRRTAAALAVTR